MFCLRDFPSVILVYQTGASPNLDVFSDFGPDVCKIFGCERKPPRFRVSSDCLLPAGRRTTSAGWKLDSLIMEKIFQVNDGSYH